MLPALPDPAAHATPASQPTDDQAGGACQACAIAPLPLPCLTLLPPAPCRAATPPPPADDKVDGAFKAYAISLPEGSELVDKIPGADPVLLFEARRCTF